MWLVWGCYTVTKASIRRATPANVLVPPKDVKYMYVGYKGIWKLLHVYPYRERDLEYGFWGLEASSHNSRLVK